MKLESIKILIDEIDYKLGRIEFFKDKLEKWETRKTKNMSNHYDDLQN